jgi:hypothetical protein
MNQTLALGLNLRFSTHAALSLRRFVAGKLCLFMKEQYITRRDDPAWTGFLTRFDDLLVSFEQSVAPPHDHRRELSLDRHFRHHHDWASRLQASTVPETRNGRDRPRGLEDRVSRAELYCGIVPRSSADTLTRGPAAFSVGAAP